MKKKRKSRGLLAKLRKSPINYFSDLFMVVMVLGWLEVLIVMQLVGVYAVVALADTTVWSYVETVVTVPLTAGGAMWLLRCCANHWNAGKDGKQAQKDFDDTDGEAVG